MAERETLLLWGRVAQALGAHPPPSTPLFIDDILRAYIDYKELTPWVPILYNPLTDTALPSGQRTSSALAVDGIYQFHLTVRDVGLITPHSWQLQVLNEALNPIRAWSGTVPGTAAAGVGSTSVTIGPFTMFLPKNFVLASVNDTSYAAGEVDVSTLQIIKFTPT